MIFVQAFGCLYVEQASGIPGTQRIHQFRMGHAGSVLVSVTPARPLPLDAGLQNLSCFHKGYVYLDTVRLDGCRKAIKPVAKTFYHSSAEQTCNAHIFVFVRVRFRDAKKFPSPLFVQGDKPRRLAALRNNGEELWVQGPEPAL
jgi:hypothetical protein